MCGNFYKRGKFAWVQDVRANYVCILDGDLVATVLSTPWEPWRVLRHFPDGSTSILINEGFEDPFAAMSRAEELLDPDPDQEPPDRLPFQSLHPQGLRKAFISSGI
jgi:hypothetical protein